MRGHVSPHAWWHRQGEMPLVSCLRAAPFPSSQTLESAGPRPLQHARWQRLPTPQPTEMSPGPVSCTQALPSLSLPAGPWREVPGTRTGLLSRSTVFRREQPPHREGSSPRGGPACRSTWETGSKQKEQRACALRPRGSPCSLPWCCLGTGPPRPRQAALAAGHPPHPFRLVEVGYLIGNPGPTSEENVRTPC